MAPHQRARIDKLMEHGARRAGAAFRRTRVENGKTVQRIEARFDGLAGCLRTPAGGSSRQIVLAIDKGGIRSRLLSPREAARVLAEEIKPIDDVRSTADYRRSVSARVLHRLLRQEGGW